MQQICEWFRWIGERFTRIGERFTRIVSDTAVRSEWPADDNRLPCAWGQHQCRGGCTSLSTIFHSFIHVHVPWQGELVEGASIHRSAVVECMRWHPSKRIIAVGWRSGEITCYNDDDRDVFEQSSIHRSPVRFLCWNQNGTRLISGDKVRILWHLDVDRRSYSLMLRYPFSHTHTHTHTHTHAHTHTHTHTHTQSGLIVVWKVDERGQLHPAPLHQHRLLAPLTHCTLHQPRKQVLDKRYEWIITGAPPQGLQLHVQAVKLILRREKQYYMYM